MPAADIQYRKGCGVGVQQINFHGIQQLQMGQALRQVGNGQQLRSLQGHFAEFGAQVNHCGKFRRAVLGQVLLHRAAIGGAAAVEHHGAVILHRHHAAIARGAHHGQAYHIALHGAAQHNGCHCAHKANGHKAAQLPGTPEKRRQHSKNSQHPQSIPHRQGNVCRRQSRAPGGQGGHQAQHNAKQQACPVEQRVQHRHKGKHQRQNPQPQRRAKQPHHQQVGGHCGPTGCHAVQQQDR